MLAWSRQYSYVFLFTLIRRVPQPPSSACPHPCAIRELGPAGPSRLTATSIKGRPMNCTTFKFLVPRDCIPQPLSFAILPRRYPQIATSVRTYLLEGKDFFLLKSDLLRLFTRGYVLACLQAHWRRSEQNPLQSFIVYRLATIAFMMLFNNSLAG